MCSYDSCPTVCRKYCFLVVMHCLWVLQSFCTLFSTNSRVWEKGCDIDVLIMSEYSTVACSLHFDPLLVSVLASIYCQMKCLWWGLGDAPIYEYNKNLLWVGPWIYNSSKVMLVHIILHNMPIAFDKAGLIFFFYFGQFSPFLRMIPFIFFLFLYFPHHPLPTYTRPLKHLGCCSLPMPFTYNSLSSTFTLHVLVK